MGEDGRKGAAEIVRLAQLVKKMRETQHRLFVDKSREMIAAVRGLEKEVDQAVDWVLANRTQAELFKDSADQRDQRQGAYPRKGRGR
jgi:hypothetical protein